MKYLALLAVVAVIYLVFTKRTPVAEVKEAMAQTEVQPLTQGPRGGAAPAAAAPAAGSSGLRRPIDRTRSVLDQAKARSGGGEF